MFKPFVPKTHIFSQRIWIMQAKHAAKPYPSMLTLKQYFWFKYDLDRNTTHPKLDPTGV